MSARVAIVTGANGFIGRALCHRLMLAGWEVRAMGRGLRSRAEHHLQNKQLLYAAYDFEIGRSQPDETNVFCFRPEQTAAVFYCALSSDSRNVWPSGENPDLKAVLRLRSLARSASPSCHFIYLSTMAAHAGARSTYGRNKLEIEQALDPNIDLIVKPGTVVGNGGIFRSVFNAAKRLPVLPIFYGNRWLQTIWLEDLTLGLLRAAERKLTGTLLLAHPNAVRYSEFYRAIGKTVSPRTISVSLPGDLALFAMRAAEFLGLALAVSSDSLLGVKHAHTFDVRASLARLNLAPLSFTEALAREYRA